MGFFLISSATQMLFFLDWLIFLCLLWAVATPQIALFKNQVSLLSSVPCHRLVWQVFASSLLVTDCLATEYNSECPSLASPLSKISVKLSIRIFIIRESTTLWTLYMHYTTTFFGRLFRSPSGRNYKDLSGKIYWGGESPIQSRALKKWLSSPIKE